MPGHLDSMTEINNRRDYDITYTTIIDANQTGATIITPTTGKRIKVAGYYIQTAGTTGTVRLYFPTSANTVGYTQAAVAPCSGYVCTVLRGAKNEPLVITNTTGPDRNVFILVNYKEE